MRIYLFVSVDWRHQRCLSHESRGRFFISLMCRNFLEWLTQIQNSTVEVAFKWHFFWLFNTTDFLNCSYLYLISATNKKVTRIRVIEPIKLSRDQVLIGSESTNFDNVMSQAPPAAGVGASLARVLCCDLFSHKYLRKTSSRSLSTKRLVAKLERDCHLNKTISHMCINWSLID